MILLGAEDPVINPETWVKMSDFKAPCDRFLLTFWKTPLDISKKILEDVDPGLGLSPLFLEKSSETLHWLISSRLNHHSRTRGQSPAPGTGQPPTRTSGRGANPLKSVSLNTPYLLSKHFS